jgi:hypothetical protein
MGRAISQRQEILLRPTSDDDDEHGIDLPATLPRADHLFLRGVPVSEVLRWLQQDCFAQFPNSAAFFIGHRHLDCRRSRPVGRGVRQPMTEAAVKRRCRTLTGRQAGMRVKGKLTPRP